MTPELTEDLPFKVLRRTWQPVALAREIVTGEIIERRLLDQDLCVARFPSGDLSAFQATCPHKGSRLAMGRVDGADIQCAYHGWRFDGTGACTDIPSLGRPAPKKQAQACLATYGVRERYGMVWVKLDDEEAAPLPDVPEFEDDEWDFTVPEPMVFHAGFRREIENYLDMTHFAFAHSTTLGLAADPVVPAMEITDLADGFEMSAPFPALTVADHQPLKLQQAHHRLQRTWMPNFTTIRQVFGEGDERMLVHVPSPIGPTECNVFWALALSPGFEGPSAREQLSFSRSVLEEDRAMCENQRPLEVPLNPAKGGWGVLVAPGDNLSNFYQRKLRRFLGDVLTS